MQKSLGAVGTSLFVALMTATTASAAVQIKTLSNRADLVYGGDVLVRVTAPAAKLGALKITAAGRDVTSAFTKRDARTLEGLVTGLRLGRSALIARVPGGAGAKLAVTNHPTSGPVFSGPQLQPWPCQPGAVDAQCNKPTIYSFQYMPTGGGGFAEYDPKNPPSDVATTTTTSGKTVPFIVRLERGWADRDEYNVAVLYDPKKPWTPLAPQQGWNSKIVVKQGAGCGSHHGAVGSPGGSPASLDPIPDVMDSAELGLGYAVMAPALDNSSHSCNIAVQSEAVMMLKEHFIETYGPMRFTIAQGCSGGSLSQLMDTNAYPGLYQGLLPSCTYPDAWSSSMDSVDCPLMEQYFEDPSKWAPGTSWSVDQEMAAEGKISPTICHAWKEVFPFWQSANPARPTLAQGGALDLQNCGLTDDQIWSADNPKGVRCSLQDGSVNIFGVRKADGYAQRPLGNEGVMYGLNALRSGKITAAQFVDLNTKIGSVDINLVWTPKRVGPDIDAVKRAYLSGAVNEATNLDKVAIIDTAAENTDIHEEYRAFAISDRLDKAHGRHDNHVVWYGRNGEFPDALELMDKWLTAVAADTSKAKLADKIVADRPKDVHDICNIAGHDDVPDEASCRQIAAAGSSTREAAGGPYTGDVIGCSLKPLRRSDYFPTQFSDDQWKQLETVFPTGVCDWSKPGISQRPNLTWRSYQDKNGNVVYGGRSLGRAPRSKRLK